MAEDDPLVVSPDFEGYQYIGEMNMNKQKHGKGVVYFSNGDM
jgi:hypothetical protein